MTESSEPAAELPRDVEAEALASCDREPIHVPGTVQSCGTLIAVDKKTRRVLYAASNLGEFLGVDCDAALGSPIEAVLDRDARHCLQNAVCVPTIASQRLRLGTVTNGERRLFGSVHERAGCYILEFEPQDDEDCDAASGIERVNWLLSQTDTKGELQPLLETSVRQLRAISGYDRVMAYAFAPDGSGEVVAESRAGHVESYLEQRFPASDIPPRARDLYRTTPIRVIADVRATEVPIRSCSPDQGDLDLSLASLRGTAEVHIQYLKNMGVRSTMTLPIICDGELWGLFAAHSVVPRSPGPATRMALELGGKLLGLQVEQLLSFRHERLLRSSVSVASTLVAIDDSELSTNQYWVAANTQLREMLPSAGVAYCVPEQVDVAGSCPSPEVCLAIAGLAAPKDASVCAMDSLRKVMPEDGLGDVGGALVLPLRDQPRATLIFFRDLISKSVLWAGRPEKDIEVSERGIRLLPRGSFDTYQETVVDQCDSWTREDLEIARSLRDSIAELLKTQRDMREGRHRLGLLVRELNHRVRNILTLIGSLASHRSPHATSIESYVETLRKRILALAETHELLKARAFEAVPLAVLVKKELRPFLSESDISDSVAGPPVWIDASAASVLGLVIHEITANAVKYGGLSASNAWVRASWRIEDEALRIRWREFAGKSITDSGRRGFGRSLIERAIGYELDGASDMRFAETGVEIDLSLPQACFREIQDASITRAIADGEGARPGGVERSEVAAHRHDPEVSVEDPDGAGSAGGRGAALVIEDSYVVAREFERILESLGFAPVDCVGRVTEAISAVHRGDYALAVLDVNLHGTNSTEVARSLRGKGVPFIVATGYGAGLDDMEYAGAVVLTKPVFREDLIQAVSQVATD